MSKTDLDALLKRPFFFCGIGGSGMLPLACVLRGRGAAIAGSDRSFDQGRSGEKFAWIERQGIALFPQDGSGVTSGDQILVASAAIEDTVPEVRRARELGCERMSRAELLSALFNGADRGIAIGGTSGKSTVTGMTGWVLTQAGRDPTIMNGAVMKNFRSGDALFASARVGDARETGGSFVSEVDESDGSIALYRPSVAVLLNVTLDHKGMDELRVLFGDYLAASEMAVVNADDAEALALAGRADSAITYGIDAADARIGVVPGSIREEASGIRATVLDRAAGREAALALQVPGRHNLSNALAALGAALAVEIDFDVAIGALGGFTGLARRFDIVGTSASGITVIDDFGHNPDKVRATLRTLRAHSGRVIAFFQPHGFGPIRQMGRELAEVFAEELEADDRVLLCDPAYFGGTVDRSVGGAELAQWISEAGKPAEHCAAREDCGERIVQIARPGDRIVVMGARDDTLSTFARAILDRLD